jgi:integrase
MQKGYELRRATSDDLIEYAGTLPFTYASQMCLINAHKLYWRLCLGRTDPGPAESIRCPKRPKMRYRGLEGSEQARALIACAGDISLAAQLACALLYFPALRCAETASLPWSADLGDWLDVMGKGAQPRTVPIHPDLRVLLDEHRADANGSPYVLPGRYPHTHVANNTVNVWCKLAGAAAGLGNVTPHMLRYTAGATMHDEAGDLRAVGEYMGHSRSSLSVTAGYTRSTEKKMRELMNTL